MKKLDKLAKLSEEHGVRVYMSFLDGRNHVQMYSDEASSPYNIKKGDGETLNHMLGRAIDAIETEFVNEPEDTITIDVSVRLYDDGHRDEWINREFDSPIELDRIVEGLRLTMMSAYKGYGSKPTPYGSWFNRIRVYVRKQNKTIVEIAVTKGGVKPSFWNTYERYPGQGKTAEFHNKMDEVPTAHLIGRFILNALKIAEKLAKRDNPATS